jgi:hypothetical protein
MLGFHDQTQVGEEIPRHAQLRFMKTGKYGGTRAFSADEGQRADYEAWVTLRYLNFEPLLAIQYRIQRRRLAVKGTLGFPGRRGSQAHAA